MTSERIGWRADPVAALSVMLLQPMPGGCQRVAGAPLALLALAMICAPASATSPWDAIHEEMRDALAGLLREYFGADGATSAGSYAPVPAIDPGTPWMLVVGFTGGIEGKDSKASGVVSVNSRIEARKGSHAGVLTFNNFRWRQAANEILRVVREFQRGPGLAPGIRQPLIVVHGHSWGAGSISKFARELRKEGLEISLGIYVDAFTLRNPRVPSNVRYAVNFYQRAGLLRGLPMRGKSKLIPEDGAATRILGNYEIKPQAERWGWSWNPLQPLFYRRHHLIAHDTRLQRYLLEIVNLKLALLSRMRDSATERAGLFERVVIIGASVSAGETAPSPGLLLARHAGTPDECIHTFAEGGAASDRHLPFLDNVARLRPTLILALDLFYHDFKFSLHLSDSKKKYLRDYVARLHDTGAVVVIGNIPPLVLLRHEHVNRYLLALSQEFPRLLVVDVRTLLDTLEKKGLVVRSNGRVTVLRKEDLFSDRVHPNQLGSTLMANFLLEQLAKNFPENAAGRGPLPVDLSLAK